MSHNSVSQQLPSGKSAAQKDSRTTSKSQANRTAGFVTDWASQPFEQRLNPESAAGGSNRGNHADTYTPMSPLNTAPIERLPLQPKLRINPPNDRYEQEADRMAEKVESADFPATGGLSPIGQAAVQTKCTECADEGTIQRMPSAGSDNDLSVDGGGDTAATEQNTSTTASAPRIEPAKDAITEAEPIALKRFSGSAVTGQIDRTLDSSAGSGKAMPESIRSYFEHRMGADLSAVRIHTDPQAAEMSRGLNAHAFTHRNHIYFGNGEYAPQSRSGRMLLAHELTHTLQQGAGSSAIQRKENKKKDEYVFRTYTVPVSDKDINDPDYFLITTLAFVFGLNRRDAKILQFESGYHWDGPYSGPPPGTTAQDIQIAISTHGDLKKAAGNIKKRTPEQKDLQNGFAKLPDKVRAVLRKVMANAGAAAEYDYTRLNKIAAKLEKLPPDVLEKLITNSAGGNSTLDDFEMLVDYLISLTPKQRNEFFSKKSSQKKNSTESAGSTTAGGNDYGFVPNMGIVQSDQGAQLRSDPSEPGGPIVPFNTPLVIVKEKDGWYFVAFGEGNLGYVEKSFVNTELPDTESRLYRIKSGDNATTIVKKHYGNFDTWGADERLYINVVLRVNQDAGRNGITGTGFPKVKVEAGKQIWIPSQEFARRLRNRGDVDSGSLSYDVYQTFMDVTVGPPVFLAGIIHGALESLWDLVKGLGELVGLGWKLLSSIFNGTIGEKIEKLFKTIDEFSLSKAISDALDTLDKRWNDENPFKRWHYRGWLIGYVLMEIILTFFTDGLVEGVKTVARSAEVIKILEKFPIINDAIELAKGLKGGKALEFVEKLKANPAFAETLEALNKARKAATEILKLPGSIVRDLSKEAIEQLMKLPERFRYMLHKLSDPVLRKLFKCTTMCTPDLGEVMEGLSAMEKAQEIGRRLETLDELIAALPEKLNPGKIKSYLDPQSPLFHPALETAVKEAKLTDLDMERFAEVLRESGNLSSKESYDKFTQFLNRTIPEKIGPDVDELNRIADDLVKANPKQGSALKGSMNEVFGKMHVEGLENAEAQVKFPVTREGGKAFREADLYKEAEGEIWELKITDDAPKSQALDYESLVGTAPGGKPVNRVNYLFTSQKAAATANRNLQGLKGVYVYYLTNAEKTAGALAKLKPVLLVP